MEPALIRFLKGTNNYNRPIAYTPLIETATPVQRLDGFEFGEKGFQGGTLFAKREDQTAPIYGGNKVRNLEFILGEAVEFGASRVHSVGPLGSNFIAALAAQAGRVGLKVEVDHFIPVTTPQITRHAQFTQRMGAHLAYYPGRRGAVPAAVMSYSKAKLRQEPFIAPGGSSPTGVLGHVSAMLELAEQVERGELPRPEVIVVGVGTCGTLAGLLLGREMLGWDTKIFGVRCVDRIVCHPRKVWRLARRTATRLGVPLEIPLSAIEMVDIPHGGYGLPVAGFNELHQEFWEAHRLYLDTTYTAKVARFLVDSAQAGRFRGQNVLYWHTFSPKAVQPALSLEKILPSRATSQYVEGHDECQPHTCGAI